MDKLKLLCVEDDIEALEDLGYLLKRYFYQIYTASDGVEALKLFNEHKPDIVLLDINLPKMSGLEVASKIREYDNKTPIIFLTAYSDKDKLLKAIELKVSSYIIKPFKIFELKDAINKVIKEISIENSQLILTNNFIWDKNSIELLYKDIQIPLTKNEIGIIKLLILNRSKFLTTNEISLEISNNDNFNDNNIVQLISRFKKKINKTIENDDFFIENIYGGGYRLK
ncbi:MAG: response regulator transcription factor [Arcobacteraceae bacterium]|nr:response regulator transcription factor [Arcobacteraceae bacterium]